MKLPLITDIDEFALDRQLIYRLIVRGLFAALLIASLDSAELMRSRENVEAMPHGFEACANLGHQSEKKMVSSELGSDFQKFFSSM